MILGAKTTTSKEEELARKLASFSVHTSFYHNRFSSMFGTQAKLSLGKGLEVHQYIYRYQQKQKFANYVR